MSSRASADIYRSKYPMNHDTAKIIANLIDPEQLHERYIISALIKFYDGSSGVIKEPENIRDLRDGHPRFKMVADVQWLANRSLIEHDLKMIVNHALGYETGGE